MRKITELAGKARRTMARKGHMLHIAEITAHVTYCGAVAAEGHGLYAMAGGVLGIVILAQVFANGGGNGGAD